MADLFNQQISATYSGLLKTSSSGVLSASLSQISDGRGNTSPLYLSTDSIQFYGAYSFPSSDGSANQVLKTDGAGVLTWENDSLSNTLNFSGGTGTGSVTLDTQVLAFTGTTNQIETSASSQAITLSFPTAGVTLPDGSIATTQTASDNSTKVATTAYVTDAIGSISFDVTKTGTITENQIAVWNDSTDELRSDETLTIGTDHSITLLQKNSVDADLNSININGGNVAVTTGTRNTGFGYENLNAITSGGNNTAIGYGTLKALAFGSSNTAIGMNALNKATGGNNVAIGAYAGQDVLANGSNTVIGYQSYEFGTSQSSVAIGYQSLRGGSATNIGQGNTAIGYQSLSGITNGFQNIAIGYQSGSAMSSGDKNVIIGSFSGVAGSFDIRASDNNIILSDGDGNIRQWMDTNGKLQLPDYGSGTHTGTLAKSLGVDTSGNVIEFTSGAGTGTVAGTGTAGTITKWATGGADIEDSIITEAASAITVGGAATFSGNVTISQPTNGNDAVLNLTSKSSVGNSRTSSLTYDADTENLIVNNAGTNALTISSGGDATFSENVIINTENSGIIVDLASRHGLMKYANYGAGLVGKDTGTDGNISTWLGRFNGTITSPTAVYQDLVISNSGNVGIGTNNPSSKLDITATRTAQLTLIELSTNNLSSGVDDEISIDFGRGLLDKYSARISGYISNFSTYDGGLKFYTSSGGTLNTTPQLTITSGGNQFVYANTANSWVTEMYNDTTTNPYGIYIKYRNTTPNSSGSAFLRFDDASQNRFQVYSNGNVANFNNSYGSLSDVKLKENILDATPKLNDLLTVKIRNYNLIGDDNKQIGVIAQELEEIFPSMVEESKDTEDREVTDEEGNVTTEIVDLGTTTKSVKYSVFTPMLIKAIQEQQTIIEDLKARIETLEG